MKKLNGFNNGRDTTDGIGGKEPYYKGSNKMNIELQQLRDEVIELKKRLTSQKKTIEMYQQELPHLKSEEVENKSLFCECGMKK